MPREVDSGVATIAGHQQLREIDSAMVGRSSHCARTHPDARTIDPHRPDSGTGAPRYHRPRRNSIAPQDSQDSPGTPGTPGTPGNRHEIFVAIAPSDNNYIIRNQAIFHRSDERTAHPSPESVAKRGRHHYFDVIPNT